MVTPHWHSPPLRLSLRYTDFPDVCFVVLDPNGGPVVVAEIKDDDWADRADLHADSGSTPYLRIAVSLACTG